eukprot:72832-Chlamydomonas_euryale.AAC.5
MNLFQKRCQDYSARCHPTAATCPPSAALLSAVLARPSLLTTGMPGPGHRPLATSVPSHCWAYTGLLPYSSMNGRARPLLTMAVFTECSLVCGPSPSSVQISTNCRPAISDAWHLTTTTRPRIMPSSAALDACADSTSRSRSSSRTSFPGFKSGTMMPLSLHATQSNDGRDKREELCSPT